MGFLASLFLGEAFWVVNKGLHYLMGEHEADAKATKFGDLSLPRAKEGVPIPLFWGTVKVSAPNVVWYGRFSTEPLPGMNEDIVGYVYRMTVQYMLGIPMEPNGGAVLKRMWMGGEQVWQGNQTAPGAPPSGGISLNLVKDYGVTRGGQVYFYNGSLTQSRSTALYNDYNSLDSYDGSLLPAYKGQTYIVFHNFLWGIDPNPPKVSFEVRSIDDPLGFGEVGTTKDANPAEVIYDILTTSWGKLGLSTSLVDTTSFTAAASTLEDENHGFSWIVYKASEARELVEEILKEIDGVLYEDPEDRKIKLSLIREDYVVGDLPLFDEANIVELLDYASSTWEETYNEVRVNYTERTADYAQKTAFAQDLANWTIQGKKKVATFHYPGITNAATADRIASRELKALSLPLAKLRIAANREAATLRPGDAFKFSWADFSISDRVFRVTSTKLGLLQDGRVIVEAVRDRWDIGTNSVYSRPDAAISDIQFPAPPEPIIHAHEMEAPWWVNEQVAQEELISQPEISHVLSLAEDPTADAFSQQTTGFNAASKISGADEYGINRGDVVQYTPRGTVETAYAKTSGPYDTTTGLRVEGLTSGFTPAAATEDEISVGGANLAMLGDEILSFESVTDIGGGVYRLNNVWRGLLDTSPENHVVGDEVWFLQNAGRRQVGTKTYDGNETVSAQTRGKSAWGLRGEGEERTRILTLANRQLLPVRPQDFTVDGSNDPGTIVENEILAAWKRRQRTLPTIDRSDNADDPDTGVTYQVHGKGEEQDWQVLDSSVDAASETVGLEPVSHGDSEIRVRATQAHPVTGAPMYSLYSPTVDCIVARYRQLLLNPTFDTGDFTSWSVDVGTPIIVTTNKLDSGGYSVYPWAAAGASHYTITQVVNVAAYEPEGLVARLRWFARNDDAPDRMEVKLEALDSSDVQTGIVTTGSVGPPSYWTAYDLNLTIPADTAKLKVHVIQTDNNTNSIGIQMDEFDLRLGDWTTQQLVNPQFNASVASWTQASGTWVSASPGFEGGAGAKCTTTGSSELYQEITLPTGYDRGTAWLRGWLINDTAESGDGDTGEIILEARDASSVLLDSVTTGAVEPAYDNTGHKQDLFLELPDDTAKIRVRYLVSNATGNSTVVDDFRLHVHKELYPVYEETADFSTQTMLAFPTKTWEWEEDYSAPTPSAVYLFDEADTGWHNQLETGQTFDDYYLTEVGTPEYAQTLAGLWDSSAYALLGVNTSLLCDAFETADGSQEGGELYETTKLSCDGTNSFAVTVALRAHDVSTTRALMGSMSSNQGWAVEIDSSGQIIATVKSDSPATVTRTLTENHGGGVPHYVTFQYDADSDEFRVWSDRDQLAAVAMPAGDASNLASARVGCDQTSNSADAQFGYGVLWEGTAAETLTPTMTEAWWQHAKDPTGLISSYSPNGIIAGDIDSDSRGVIVGRFAPEQIALFRNAGLTEGRGISTHRDLTNLVDSDPNSSAWVEGGSPTVTKRFADDAEVWHRSVKVEGDNTDYYRPPKITLGAGDVTVVWYGRMDSEHLAQLTLTNDGGGAPLTYYWGPSAAQVDKWVRYEQTIPWAGGTAAFELRFAPSDNGTTRTIELSTPVGVFDQDWAPMAIPPGTAAVTKAILLLNDMTPPDEFNEEGEISITGILDRDTGAGTSNPRICNIHNGTDNNDRRELWIDATADELTLRHYTGAGAYSENNIAATTWDSEWTARGRWNFGRLLEDATKFAKVDGFATEADVRVATWAASAVAVDEIEIGYNIGGLVSEVKLMSRERIPE